ncbi:MAG: hypothetical protein AAGP08_00290 [Pseudomonadota bacterium]
MPSFRFRGFETGSTVSLSATQGTNSDSATVASWGQSVSTPITANLSAIRTEGTAPLGTILYADTASPAARVVHPYHDIENVWSFDDPGVYNALGNSPLWGDDKNIAYGPRAAHVFSTAKPGNEDYMVTCVSHDGENAPRTSSIDIKVNDPDDVFAGADTAVVSGASNFAGAPSGAAQFTSIAAARSHLAGRTNARLLLRAGETFGSVDISESGGSNRRYYVGRFGSGNRPIISLGNSGNGVNFNTGGGGSTTFEEVIVSGLEIRGSYDATTATSGSSTSADAINFSSTGRTTHKTVWDCRISGVGKGIRLEGTVSFSQAQRNFYMGNTRIENWLDYGVFTGDGGDWGLAGCTIQQPTGTINGQSKPGGYADHGPFRISRAYGVVVLSCCDWSSFNDWSGNSGNRVFQPIIRWNTGNGEANPELVIDRFRGEGGPFRLYNAVQNDTGGGPSSTRNPAWIVADRVHHVLSDHPGNSPNIPLGGTTLRNCVFVVPNNRAGWSIGFRNFIDTGGIGSNANGNQNRRQEVYSCAFIDLRTDAFSGNRTLSNTDRDYDLGGIGAFTPHFLGNNIEHTPRMSTGGAPSNQAPLETAARYTPLYDGERWEGAAVDTSRSYTDEVTASFKPEAGSSAIGAASGKVSLLDMDGNLRSDVLSGLSRNIPSVGPFEPNLEG